MLEASGVTLVERHEQAGASPFLTTDHPFYPADLADRDSQPTLRALGKLRELVAGASRT